MKKIFFNSLKFQIALASVLLVASAVGGVVFYMQQEMEKINSTEQYRNARTLLQSVQGSVENQYKSILFHKNTMLEARKDELHSVIDMAHATLQGYYELVQTGKLSEQEAKERVKQELQQFRYKNGVGYIWINDMGRPYPKMIMHPTIQNLDGKILDSPEFNCALGRDENFFKAFVDVVTLHGEGYVDYQWPKPTEDGLTEQQSKISFVKGFAPWDWVIGSSLYVDDLDLHVNKRIEAVLGELNETFGGIRIAESGYIYIFTGQRRMIYHPLYKGTKVINQLVNPATGNNILDDLIEAAGRPDGKIEYIWDKPQNKGEFRFKKIAFISYFEPLDWYIGTSFYLDEVEQPARQLRYKALLFSLFFLVIAVLLALYTAHAITRPLQRIMEVFSAGARGDYSARLQVERSDEVGQLAGYFNRFIDEIENSHNQLSLSENRFRTLFEKSGDARFIIEDDHFTECNEAAVKMIRGNCKEDVLGLHPAELSPEFQPDGRRSNEKSDAMIRIAHEQGSLSFLWHPTRLDGEVFPAEVELTSIPYKDREILHVLLRDITHQKEIEQQLVQSQKMETVGTLAGGLAHDFNNVLGGIVGIVSLLKFQMEQGGVDEQTLKCHLATMEQAGRRATAMVQQLLALSRKQEITFVPVDLNLSLKHVRKIAENSFDKSVALDFIPWVEDAMTLADPGQIEQVLLNCCVNGAHAMTLMRTSDEKTGGTLKVTIDRVQADNRFRELHTDALAEKYWCVSVRDFGVGMDEKTREKIFDPFFTTKEKDQGTGLGLSMVYNIVKDLKGFIGVESELGEGATFNLYFPVETGERSAEEPSSASQLKKLSGKGVILVVDDGVVMRNMATDVLQEFGYQVITANDGKQGRAIFKERGREIQAVILDMAMPVMSGREAYLEMRKIDPEVKVILVSGFLQDARVQEILDLGVSGFIQKPYSVSRLMEELKGVLNGSGNFY